MCWAVPLLTCTVPEYLIHYNEFPTEVAEVLKWSFLICTVPVAFNGVQTRVLVDALLQEITATVHCFS